MIGQLQQIPVDGAGSFGLNTEDSITDPRWLVEGSNIVYNETGKITSRKGITALTTTGDHSDPTEAIHEYIQSASSSEIISAGGLLIYEGTATLTDITGTITTPTEDDWQFVNYNGKCIGVQQAHTPIVYSGTTFADIVPASGTLPTGNCALSAFGRLWVADLDKTTLKFCDILDETNWSNAGSGSLDTLQVWPDGIDTITALAEMQNQLLIFGTRSILVYTGAEDPTAATFVLVDIIIKGTKFRDSVVAVGNDLLFFSDDGIRSVSRGIEFSTLPLTDLSSHIRSTLITQSSSATKVQAAYSPNDRAYLMRIVLPDTEFFWYFDLLKRLPDGDLRAFEWNSIGYQSIHVGSDNRVYMGMTGKVGEHSGYQDDGASYFMTWLTAGSYLGVQGQKVLKSVAILIACSSTTTMRIRWAVDFSSNIQSTDRKILCDFGATEWNEPPAGGDAEWGIGEWSGLGQVALKRIVVPLSMSGDIVQIGGSATINGFPFSFSSFEVLAKIGRLAA